MPVLILDDQGTTAIRSGAIKLTDLQKMITDYRRDVTVSGTPNGSLVIPKFSFYFTKLQLDDLFASNFDPRINGIEISLAVQLPGSSIICHGEEVDTSNSMVAVIRCAHIDTLARIKDPISNVDGTVLINGYAENTGDGAESNCCPSTSPPPNT